MTQGEFKKNIRLACNFSKVLQPDFMETLLKRIVNDVAMKAQPFKDEYDLTTTATTLEYATDHNVMTISKVVYGSEEDLDEGGGTTLVRGKDFVTIWKKSGANPGSIIIKLAFDPGSGDILRITTNDLSDFGLDLADANDTTSMDDTFNPIVQNALIQGFVQAFKLEYLASPTSQASSAQYHDTLNEILAIFNERVDYV